MFKPLTHDQVRLKLKCRHGDLYEFPHIECEYKRNTDKITGVCKVHGEFRIITANALNGAGCITCGYEATGNSKRLSIDQAISKIKAVLKSHYTLIPPTKYVNNTTPFSVICELHDHGPFSTNLNKITNGVGCPKCGHLATNATKRVSFETAVNTISTISDYEIIDMSNYNDTRSIIVLKCNKHGSFKTNLMRLNAGSGCPDCGVEQSIIAKRNISTQNGLADYERYHNRLPITDGTTCGTHGELLVKCKMCQQLITPTLKQVNKRIYAINNLNQGECNFYCSDKCRSECTIYDKRTDSHLINGDIKNYDAKVREVRRCQPESKYRLRQIQFDTYGYHFCEKCGDRDETNQLHHTIEVAKDPANALSPAGHMLVCDKCHKVFTKECR